MEAFLASWRARLPRSTPQRRHGSWGAPALTAALAALVLFPVVVVVALALSPEASAGWTHLWTNVIPRSTATTLYLLALVGGGTSIVGVMAAFAVAAFDFPFRRTLAWLLVLPIAIPPYLAAYSFGEFFTFTGPVQSAVRAIGGYASARDYWFPDIRSTEGAAFVLTTVLYPYVYLASRVVFLLQGRNVADVARTLGARSPRVLFGVLLPIARPAIIAGLALVMMETLNDIGAVEYLGVPTLTFSIYSTWLSRGSLEGAAQIALVMMVLVVGLIFAEQWSRRQRRYHNSRATHLYAHPPRIPLGRFRSWVTTALVALPVIAGFGVPLAVLGRFAFNRIEQFASPAVLGAAWTSIGVGLATAVLTVVMALALVVICRAFASRRNIALSRLATAGYALPGSIFGLGLLFGLGRLDNWVDGVARDLFGISTGLLLSGSAIAIVYACSARFLALAEGNLRSGLDKLPNHVDAAARTLGATGLRTFFRVLLPLLRPAIMTAGVLVFVDTVKELSATILLRPFGFQTLATYVYENASRGSVEDGAAAALLIVAVSTIPVIALSRALASDRAV